MSVEAFVIDTPFIEAQFPPKISYGSSGGPGFKTSMFVADSGLVGGISVWDHVRARYEVNLDFLFETDLDAVQNHFYVMRGRGIGFRYKDWLDFAVQNQNFFVGDGTTTVFQLYKRYTSGAFRYSRPIRKPVTGTLTTLTVDNVSKTEGVDFTVDYTTGEFTFGSPPATGAVGRVGYIEYDVPVRYDTDNMDIQSVEFDQYVVSSLTMLEILV